VSFWQLLRDVNSGKSVLRSLEDRALARQVRLRGVSVDLGGGASGYLNRFERDGPITRVVVDLRHGAMPHVVADFERGLPFATGSLDTVLLHNVLEHVFGPEALIEEVRRTLKPGGRVYFSVPFIMPLHQFAGDATYGDYRRFSGAALARMFSRFDDVSVTALEVGPFTAAAHMALYAVPIRVIRALLVALALPLDETYARLRTRRDPRTRMAFVLGYVGSAAKESIAP
jgi:SAM-dependent methyltransferase